ncbi:MAG: DUF4139 domain-containing protein [Myxococcales bacterium]|nr:DUF4139 domain-containing protein [Myxococcales bacterium]
MAPERAKKRAGLGGMIGSAFDGGGGGGGPEAHGFEGASEEARAEPELIAGRDLLDYGRLQLLPADNSRRGTLHRLDLRAFYEQVSGEGLSLGEAFDSVEEARRNAEALEASGAPSGHRWPTSEAGFDYAYVANGNVDLESDGAFHSLPIDQRDCQAAPRYVTVPRESQEVFRTVAVQNPLQAPLLPGPADIYVDGKFALTSAFELTPADGRIELGLGVEQAIKVARNVSFSEESSGMFKRSVELRHTVVVDINNHLSQAATVEVRERLPHVADGSNDDDLRVETGSVNPPWQDYEQDQPRLEAGRMWRVEVPAAGQRKVSATWVVTIPKDHELVGGNRRES